jgi:hypothetical protein
MAAVPSTLALLNKPLAEKALRPPVLDPTSTLMTSAAGMARTARNATLQRL